MHKTQRKKTVEGSLLLKEIQHLWDTWIRYLVLIDFLVMFILVSTIMISDPKISVSEKVLIPSIIIIIGILTWLFLRKFALELQITTAGIFIKYLPFDSRYYFIPKKEVQSYEIRKNKSLQSGKSIRKNQLTLTILNSEIFVIKTEDGEYRIGSKRTNDIRYSIEKMYQANQY